MPSDRDNGEERAASIDKIVPEQGATSDIRRTHSSPSGSGETLFVWVERLRQEAEEFQRTVEEEFWTTGALLEEARRSR